MAYEPKNFDHLLKDCKEFLSENQLKAHFTLYQGYVKKLNEIEERLGKADRGTANYSFGEYSELRRREPVAYNGTVLHELYFSNLGAPGQEAPAVFQKAISDAFGSMDAWVADVRAIVGSGHGWCQVLFDWNFMKIRNNFIQTEHHVGLLPNTSTLLAIDAWEHAYFLDYGTRKPDYLSGVLKHINWKAVEERLRTMTPLMQGQST
jgi:Fe-Mn family superoxide dismutase